METKDQKHFIETVSETPGLRLQVRDNVCYSRYEYRLKGFIVKAVNDITDCQLECEFENCGIDDFLTSIRKAGFAGSVEIFL